MLAGMDGRVPVILCMDVEPDEHTFPPEDPSPWRGFERLMEGAPSLRARLSSLTGAPAALTWALRIDPQIAEGYGDPAWVLDRHRGFFERVRDLGDTVGVHPHAWRWIPEGRQWIADHGDPAWVDRCIEMSFEEFAARFAEPPRLHRFGSRFLSNRVLETATRLGARIDMTLEPGEPQEGPGRHRGELWAGVIPDYGAVPRQPYRPDPADFARPAANGRRALWELPLSSGRLALHPRRVRRAVRAARHPVRTLRSPGRGAGGGRGAPHGVLAMWRDWRSPRHFWDAVFDSIRGVEHPYLAFAIRSDTPVTTWAAERFDGIMAGLDEDPRAEGLVFTTPEDTLRRLGLEP